MCQVRGFGFGKGFWGKLGFVKGAKVIKGDVRSSLHSSILAWGSSF